MILLLETMAVALLQASAIGVGILLIGYLFGFGFCRALKHSKIAPIQLTIQNNLMAPDGEYEDDSGPGLSGGLKDYQDFLRGIHKPDSDKAV